MLTVIVIALQVVRIRCYRMVEILFPVHPPIHLYLYSCTLQSNQPGRGDTMETLLILSLLRGN